MEEPRQIVTLGAREWLALPEFAIACIEARIDPEVSASRLHAVDLRPVEIEGQPGLEFRVYPLRGDPRTFVGAAAPLADRRGAGVVRTVVTLGATSRALDLELVAEEPGGFPMVLGTAAMGYAVDSNRSFLAGPPSIAAGGRRQRRPRR